MLTVPGLRIAAGLVAAGLLIGSPAAGMAQNRTAGPSVQPRGQVAPRQPANAAVQPVGGVANAALNVPDVSPQLEKILRDWSEESRKITELRGEHGRIVYDHVFEVSKRAVGHFYYKAPDQGRIDLNPEDVKSGAPDPDMKNTRGQPYTISPDQKERWICDGQKVWRIDDTKKEAEVFTIPVQDRGANIMDGPLPFLFGLPPEKAKRRFEFTLKRETGDMVWLHVRPRLADDARNWREAEVMLLKNKNYLPSAVKLKAPSGKEETVYAFKPESLKIGPQRSLIPLPWNENNPFDPDIPEDYTVTEHKPQAVGQAAPPPVLPSFVGLHGTRAVAILKQLQCDVQWVKGEVTNNEKLINHIYRQAPQPGTPLQQGMVVTLTYHPEPPKAQPAGAERNAGDVAPRAQPMGQRTAAASGATEARPSVIEMPDVRNMHWQKAKAVLQQAGCDVERIQWVKGATAPRLELAYVVTAQKPAPGTRIKPDDALEITAYGEPMTASRRD